MGKQAVSRWLIAGSLFFTTALRAVEVAEIAAPKVGPWKDQPPGAYVIFDSTAWDTGHVIRREDLLGVDHANRVRHFPHLVDSP